ncbi:MAG: hypothetical protein Q9191_002836 [Dirinaria sp. TL-2023a]
MPAWWCDERIRATVNSEYVCREIGSSKRLLEQLHRPLSFGQGLTDDSYLDWIVQKGRRLFLTLNDIGVPESIFQVLDKSLDDEDLPLSEDALWELNLFGGKSETIDKKFFKQQFKFLVREIEAGDHVDYEDGEVVPIEPVSRRPSVSGISWIDKVHVGDRLYTRKKISTSGDTGIDRVHFVMHAKALHEIRHPHLVCLWASYTQSDYSFLLLTPSVEINLKAFLEEQPKSFKQLEKSERHKILLKWTLCLASALAYLHNRELTHQSIRPSSISVSHDNTIYLSDFAALRALDQEEISSPYKAEIYDHAAPENWQRKACLHETSPLKTIPPSGGRTMRRVPTVPDGTPRSGSISSNPSHRRTLSQTESSSSSSTSHRRNALITTFAPPSLTGSPSFPADVFSLSTILLHLLSLLLGHSPKSSAAYRGKHNRLAGRGGAPPDASFHKNLQRVGSWIDDLQHQAKEKERIFRKAKVKGKAESIFWASVSGTLGICREGLRKEAKDRIDANRLEKEVRLWLDRGLGMGRRWCCGGEDEEVIPGISFSSVTGVERVPEVQNKDDNKSLGSVSIASSEDLLPIERPLSVADTLSVEGTSVIHRKGEDMDSGSVLLPEEDDQNWPIRQSLAPLPYRQKAPYADIGPLEFHLSREEVKRKDYFLARRNYYELE